MKISVYEWLKVKKVVSSTMVNFLEDGDELNVSEIVVVSGALISVAENLELTDDLLEAIQIEIENVFHEIEILEAKADFGIK